MATPFLQISGDAQLALQNFSTELYSALALAEVESWANQIGIRHTGQFRTKFPVPVSAAGFVLRQGDDRYRSLGARSISFMPTEYQDGVEAEIRKIEAPDFVDWAGEPTRIALEAARLPNTLCAQMLEANRNLAFYRDEQTGSDLAKAQFAADHPVNLFDPSFGTFSNVSTATTINATFAAALDLKMGMRPGPNGKPMGLIPRLLIVPQARKQMALDFYESEMLLQVLANQGNNASAPSGAVRNRWYKATTVVVANELTDPNVVYAVDPMGPAPWVIQSPEAPTEIVFDKFSEYARRTGKVQQGYVLLAGCEPALPHAIEKITLNAMS